jgi:hypothetical protein
VDLDLSKRWRCLNDGGADVGFTATGIEGKEPLQVDDDFDGSNAIAGANGDRRDG